jgi:hypothetical protein
LRFITRLIVLDERPNARAISLTPLMPCSMLAIVTRSSGWSCL